MKLKYNVLWFEDNEDWIDSIYEQIEDFLLENAFILNIDIQKNATNVNQLILDINNHLKDVDIILMDFNLLNSDKGDAIIKKIRNSEIYTEIIFYSEKEDVKKRFIKECIEGIYFSDREIFIQRFKQIIPHTIKKVLDLTNMRGLVMAETSSLDLEMNELLITMFAYLDNNKLCKRQELIDKIFHKRLLHADRIKGIEHEMVKVGRRKEKKFLLDTNNKDEYINDISLLLDVIEPSDRYQAINKLAKTIIELSGLTQELHDNFKKYELDVIKKRNILAHVKEDLIDGKIVLRSHIKGYEQFCFSHKEFQDIRSALIFHSENLTNMRIEIVKNMNP